jgi:hypothetical protein
MLGYAETINSTINSMLKNQIIKHKRSNAKDEIFYLNSKNIILYSLLLVYDKLFGILISLPLASANGKILNKHLALAKRYNYHLAKAN